MARPKEFERDAALQQAIDVFADHGFEGSSTDALLKAMGISRQSLYDTFGDKWALYLEALQRYAADSISEQIDVLNAAPTGLAGVEALLMHMIEKSLADPNPRCLGISAICEFGRSNREVNLLSEIGDRTLFSAIERRLADGALPDDLQPAEAARFVQVNLSAIKLAARGGAPAERLRGIVRMTMRSLR